ncbi:unnamed protein product [Fusarium graminearum]|uniref:Chromosome 3, complete genome n=2 Tax=Gibberella zeae TaxID=5518 RepID=A0A098E4I6_GIBZE|nr:unnamed protein product [Fusarium graminearum]CAF3615421.1 unnamed protein product [Fusarium graminearum]CAG1959372.1 unnamed protein product [Fusarium graminearum]CAG1986249.1 unnamed protein product [Fusarium graminearum]CAG2010913.1 unnamed protein product [Fusarium graminearum]
MFTRRDAPGERYSDTHHASKDHGPTSEPKGKITDGNYAAAANSTTKGISGGFGGRMSIHHSIQNPSLV